MQIRQRFLSIFASGMALSAGAIAGDETPSAPPAPTTAVSASPSPTSNKIWECTAKGVRTFSSNPCGTNSTVRELNPINVMEPAPMYRVTHTHATTPVAQSTDYADSTQAASDAISTDSAYNAYPGYVVVTRSHRTRGNSGRTHPHPHH